MRRTRQTEPDCPLRLRVRRRNIKIAIIAVPATSAQIVVDRVVDAGIEAVLNYAPVTVRVPPHVRVQNVDPVLSLQSMTYHLTRSRKSNGVSVGNGGLGNDA